MADETPEQDNDGLVLTDEDNEPTTLFPSGGGAVEGFFGVDGSTKIPWSDMESEAKRVVYVFDSVGGLRFYLRAQLIDGYIKMTTEMA